MTATCEVCREPLHRLLVEAGEHTHPTCADRPARHLHAVAPMAADDEANLLAMLQESTDEGLGADEPESEEAEEEQPGGVIEVPDGEGQDVYEALVEDAERMLEMPHNGTPAPVVPVLDPEDTLFPDMEVPPPVALRDRFGVPPFSVWDKRSSEWQNRRRKWMSMGIRSELGRDEGLTIASTSEFMIDAIARAGGTTSIFDPVVCELAYRWWSNPGDVVLDPFAGGSVRGIVAGVLQRQYVGNDLRKEQVLANRAQAGLVGSNGVMPSWHEGDATDLPHSVTSHGPFDFVLSCPPYADLEVYSDDPRDISTFGYPEFTMAHEQAIANALQLLRPNRFAVWVISDVRDPKSGAYRGLVADTISAFQQNGGHLYNDIILLDPVGTARLRGPRYFNGSRKVVRTHQHVLVFVKGNGKTAAKRLDTIDPQALKPAE